MREINFRAWDRLSKEMNYDDFDMPVMEFNEGIRDMQRERYILMQFTGLHDKNGKEIYEGDIVRKDGWIYEIRWSKYGAGFDLATKNDSWPKQEDGYAYHSGLYDTEIIEVIGNVWENNELAK